MDNNNWRPSLPNGEPAMDTGGWRTQLPPDSRQKIVNKIMETLEKHLPFSGPEEINELMRIAASKELRRIAARFEEKVFSGAVNQTDYLRKISTKMITMEIKSQNAAGSSSSIPAANNGTSMDSIPTNQGITSTAAVANNVTSIDSEPAVNTGDWRTQLPPDSRQRNAYKIMESLEKHVPNLGLQGINELMRIAVSFEDLIFKNAINQVDYFRKISFRMLSC